MDAQEQEHYDKLVEENSRLNNQIIVLKTDLINAGSKKEAERIKYLELEIKRLTNENVDYLDRIHELEEQLARATIETASKRTVLIESTNDSKILDMIAAALALRDV